MIYKVIDKEDFCDAFTYKGRGSQFSYEARDAIFDYLDTCGQNVELDVIGICCEFCEVSADDFVDNGQWFVILSNGSVVTLYV